MYKILSFFSGYLSFLVAKLLVLLEKQFVFFGFAPRPPGALGLLHVARRLFRSLLHSPRRLFRSLFHTQNTTKRIHTTYILA